MVILLKQHAPQAEQDRLLSWLRELGAEVRVTGTPERPFFCLTGDISRIDPEPCGALPGRGGRPPADGAVPPVQPPPAPEPTVVSVGGARFGGGNFGLIAGAVRRGIGGADLYGSPAGQGRGRLPAARRGIQAAHLSL